MMAGKAPVALLRSGEVGMQAAAGSSDVGARAVEEPLTAKPVERREVVAVLVHVDVEDVRARSSGGDGHIAVRVARPPPGDLVRVGGGIEEPVPGDRDLLLRYAGEHRPGRLSVPQRRSEPGVRALLPGPADRLACSPITALWSGAPCHPHRGPAGGCPDEAVSSHQATGAVT